LPIEVNLVKVEIAELVLGDEQPTPQEGYEVVMVKDLGWTKLWMIFKIIMS